jgi:hypothetical protein
VSLTQPWWWSIYLPLLWLLWKASLRSPAPLSPWTFLCPERSKDKQSSLKSSRVSIPAFLCGLLGITLTLTLLSHPQHPRRITVLCREVDFIREQSSLDLEMWQLNLAEQLKISPSRMTWTDHSGSPCLSLDQLVQDSKGSETWELPQQLGTDVFIASRMDFNQDQNFGTVFPYPSHWSSKDEIKKISADPARGKITIQLGTHHNIHSIQLGRVTQVIAKNSVHSERAKALEWPWPFESSELKIFNDQGGLIKTISIPTGPHHSLEWTSSVPLASTLITSLSSFKTHQPQHLDLSNSIEVKNSRTLRSRWFFLEPTSPMTNSLPAGLPRVSQTSIQLASPILHTPFDWPLAPWPTHYLNSGPPSTHHDVLLSTSNFPLVIKEKLMGPALYLSISSNVNVISQLWDVLLESTFPMPKLRWSYFDTEPVDLSAIKPTLVLFSMKMQFFLTLCATTLFSSCLFFIKRS